MTPDPHTPPALAALVDAMMDSCGQLATIIDHMERNRGRAEDADPPAVILRDLLLGTLVPLPMRHGLDDIATTAQMLSAATDLIGEEILLVNSRWPGRPR